MVCSPSFVKRLWIFEFVKFEPTASPDAKHKYKVMRPLHGFPNAVMFSDTKYRIGIGELSCVYFWRPFKFIINEGGKFITLSYGVKFANNKHGRLWINLRHTPGGGKEWWF